MRVTFKVDGLAACEEALADLPKATNRNVLKRALFAAGAPVEVAARARAPRLTGHLQRRIAVSTKLSRRQRKAAAKASAVEVYVGAGPLPHAHLQEFGTADMPPQPFLRPAVDAQGRRMIEEFRDTLQAEVKKAMARHERKAARLAAKIKAGK
jgi:HK97 gp10 family phage protein